MARINIYAPADDPRTLIGWFDPSTAVEAVSQGTFWDGNNNVGVISRSQCVDEYLYRTKGGRWVHRQDAHRYRNGPDTYEFYDDEQAKDWLIRSEDNDDVLERYFGDIEEETGPGGRPEVGPAFSVRFPPELLARVDAAATENGQTRAAWLRAAAVYAMDAWNGWQP